MTFRYLLRCSFQRGALSPFMFGLMVGMSIFSVMSLTWAKRELERQQQRNAAHDRAQANDVAKAIEFSLLTETQGTYRDDIDLNRAMVYTDTATTKTRGGENVLVTVRQQNEQGAFGAGTQRVGIIASDDILQRSQVHRSANAEDINQLAGQKNSQVVAVDTEAIRIRQMRVSMQGLEGMAEQVYAFYAGNMRFPNPGEYDLLARQFNFHDAWGGKFDYEQGEDETAFLSFTTPWNYTYTQKLSLKDEYEQKQE